MLTYLSTLRFVSHELSLFASLQPYMPLNKSVLEKTLYGTVNTLVLA